MARYVVSTYAGLFFLVSVLAFAPAAPVPTHLMKPPTMVFFPTTVGSEWVYSTQGREEKQRVVQVEKQTDKWLVHVRRNGNPMFAMSVAKGVLVFGHSSLEKPFRPFTTLLQLKGREDAKPQRWDVFTSMGFELVEVPAGQFQAIRVEESAIDGGPIPRRTYWYAEGIGEVKCESADWSRELKSFTPGSRDATR